MIALLDKTYIKLRPAKALSRLISYVLFEGRPLTTRGRWINPLVFSLFSLEKKLPQLKPVKTPIFILGTGRSGTTMLGMILSMHREIGFLNEPKALWHSVCPFEDLVGNYTLGRASYRLGSADATDDIRESAHRLYGFYLALSRSRRVVDKYPEMIFRIPFIQSIFSDAKFIFLVRNGWDACHSIALWSKRHGLLNAGTPVDWWGMDSRKWNLLVSQVVSSDPILSIHADVIKSLTLDTDRAAVEWMATMREGMKMMDRFPELLHQIRYEDIVSRPEATLTELLNFCGLEHDTIMIEYARTILKPVKPRPSFDLHPELMPIFKSIMTALRYTNE